MSRRKSFVRRGGSRGPGTAQRLWRKTMWSKYYKPEQCVGKIPPQSTGDMHLIRELFRKAESGGRSMISPRDWLRCAVEGRRWPFVLKRYSQRPMKLMSVARTELSR